MTRGLSAVWRVTDLYGKWVTINSSIVRWKKLNCSSQVVIVYRCSQLTSESADAKAAFSFADWEIVYTVLVPRSTQTENTQSMGHCEIVYTVLVPRSTQTENTQSMGHWDILGMVLVPTSAPKTNTHSMGHWKMLYTILVTSSAQMEKTQSIGHWEMLFCKKTIHLCSQLGERSGLDWVTQV